MMVTLFIFMISLLLLHEMDAIRTKEWKMFFILKDIPDEKAYKIFTLFHFPLYFCIFMVMVHGENLATNILYLILDIFLIGHSIIHFCFRKKSNNRLSSLFSKSIIYSLGILAILHLLLMLFNHLGICQFW